MPKAHLWSEHATPSQICLLTTDSKTLGTSFQELAGGQSVFSGMAVSQKHCLGCPTSSLWTSLSPGFGNEQFLTPQHWPHYFCQQREGQKRSLVLSPLTQKRRVNLACPQIHGREMSNSIFVIAFSEKLVTILVTILDVKVLMVQDRITRGEDLPCPLTQSKSRHSPVSEKGMPFGSLSAINSCLQWCLVSSGGMDLMILVIFMNCPRMCWVLWSPFEFLDSQPSLS